MPYFWKQFLVLLFVWGVGWDLFCYSVGFLTVLLWVACLFCVCGFVCFPNLLFIVCNIFSPLFSFLIPLQLEVHEAKPVPENHPQWDTAIEGDEDQEDSEGFEDSFEEEEEEEEDDD